mmetsp:Transcript_32383/g.54140  ORF Transcript_32383/g.54140 Transcript_32383/m.54140 type:complete len:385 (+) Transcript_32383:118-1272(+)
MRNSLVLCVVGLAAVFLFIAENHYLVTSQALQAVEEVKAENMLQGIKALGADELANTETIADQERIDTIVRAFKRLPGMELDALRIDLDQPILEGTVEASALFDAWTLRQQELREAMKNVLQPAELMANITRQLNATILTSSSSATTSGDPEQLLSGSLSVEEKVYLLKQLESLLDDVDNARDFHTIGAWPTLISFLSSHRPGTNPNPLPAAEVVDERTATTTTGTTGTTTGTTTAQVQVPNDASIRSAAAWAVGTAVKNNYDYQLWTLEKSCTTSSGTGSGTGSSTSSAYAGRVGFITSMSSHFCGTCNRLRVTADGQLKVCLFGADGLNILSLMRDGYTDKAIIEQLGQAVKQKKAALGGHTTASDIASHSEQNRPMILIGG